VKLITDKFGHCIKCGKNLITEKVINGEVKKIFTSDYDQIKVLLDDESQMRVVMCTSCKEVFKGTEKEKKVIMASVIAGWQNEVDKLKWNEDRKEKYMKRYRKLKIKSQIKEFKYGVNQ
jgi:hypothetical protein